MSVNRNLTIIKLLTIILIIFVSFLVTSNLVVGFQKLNINPEMKTSSSWGEHLDVASVVISLLFAGLVWFSVRTLNTINSSIQSVCKRISDLDKEVKSLQGEHKTMMRVCPVVHPRRDDE